MKPEQTVQKVFGEHPYATIVEGIRDFAIILVDHEGHVLSWNQGAQHIFGYDKSEIIGRSFVLLFTPEDQQSGVPQEELQKAQAEGRAEVIRWHQRKDGSRFWANGITTTVRAESGNLLGYAKVARDDTPRKLVEDEREHLIQALKIERSRLSSIFSKAPAFVAALRGPQHIFDLVNPAYYQLTGHRDLIGKTIREALPELDGQGYFEILDRVFETGEPYEGRGMRIWFRHTVGSPLEERFVDLLYQPLIEADGSVSGIFSQGIDITEQVRAREEAETSNRTKDEFLATLSHELRTPLSSILGWAGLLQSGRPLAPEEMALGLETIERNAKAQAGLIEDILDVSRVMTGKLRLEVLPVDLASVIAEAVSSVLPAADAKSIRLQRVLDPGASIVAGDRTRLQQVVWNLLSNALKFTPKGGWVQIHLKPMDSHIEMVVSDNGQGVSPEMLPHIFERFRQADSSSTRAHSGLGLGLPLVRHLVELHGGSVEAHSSGVGHGATFTVRLPRVASRIADIQPPVPVGEQSFAALTNGESPVLAGAHVESGGVVTGGVVTGGVVTGGVVTGSPAPKLDGLHILIVDDDEDTRRILTAVLEKSGARVTAVASAPEALAALTVPGVASRPGVLVSDIGMPGEDGYSLITKVRKLSTEQGGRIPALALTAYAGVEDRMEALRCGFQVHLSKPIQPIELITSVANLVGRS